ncbi:MAG: hypothetical protein CL596_08795 [Alteromonas sp.]|nr:hypothetical protein [Alteromonas sp.]MAY21712.1 hypothetical protein [Flavobacteriaceae bacterium]|tara:strand:+ start:182 stop:532 length:351 start_codon:yes stop_codon:yes gene_type:complete
MDTDYDHLLNSVIKSVKRYDQTFEKLETELKHKLLLSITEQSFFPEDPPINVNIHFLKFKKSKTERNRWNYVIYMYSPTRGIEYGSGTTYPEISQKLYEIVQEMARMDEIFRTINN